ncbi:MAG: hypothetical protein V3T81_04605 [Thermoanaerobaculia bacterium]
MRERTSEGPGDTIESCPQYVEEIRASATLQMRADTPPPQERGERCRLTIYFR